MSSEQAVRGADDAEFDSTRGGSRRSKRQHPSPSANGRPSSRRARSVSTSERTGRARALAFPVVGIGASAGGLEALEHFLRHVPPHSGMAFVVIQHLDPTRPGMLPKLLQRATHLRVAEATDGLRVAPECVYVIPPNADMSLLHGVLYLLPATAPRGLRLPIDFFFRSLAQDLQERGLGVILSGMGSDGTLGLEAIKERAGATFVQAPSSAKFEGMPRSAIDAGVADVVADVHELPEKIMSYLKHARRVGARLEDTARDKAVEDGAVEDSAVEDSAVEDSAVEDSAVEDKAVEDKAVEDKAQSPLEKIYILLRAQTGNDFSLYKKSTIHRRIERRMGLHQIGDIAHYVRFLRENSEEIELLFQELLIGVTCFFRDRGVWNHLKTHVLPLLLAQHSNGKSLRAWVPGCSTGEEAYSLAISFREAMEGFEPGTDVTLQVFATDLDLHAIEKARRGFYPASIAADVSPERLRRYFVKEGSGYRVGKNIREMVVFAKQNIIMDPPFTKLDLVSCRNLLIYLSAELQKTIVPLFHYSLNRSGILLLGTSETIGTFSSLFSTLDAKTRVYQKLERDPSRARLELPASLTSTPLPLPNTSETDDTSSKTMISPNLQTVFERVLMQRYSPVGVLCNENGDLLYASGRTGKYLEPTVGKANLNIFAMAREGLGPELSQAFSIALREQRAVTVRGLKVGTNGGTQIVDLTVEKLLEPKELRETVIVVISEVVSAPPLVKSTKSRGVAATPLVARLQEELQRAREDAQSTRWEMQNSQEELRAANEELQSTNEELQSTNEELTTSKEEMQSLYEELQTVNYELQSKVDELSRSNNDMRNLLDSTDIATLFLDSELCVRRFTQPMTKLIKLIPLDFGRSITDLASALEYQNLAEDAREVLRTLMYKEMEVKTRDGRLFALRIMPYRTLQNVIDGVVMTFTDASTSQALRNLLDEQSSHLRQVAASLPSLGWGSGPDGSCNYLSPKWVEYTGVPATVQYGEGWLDQVHPEDRGRVIEAWRVGLCTQVNFETELRIRSARGEYRWFKTCSVPIRSPLGDILTWFSTSMDIDALKAAERQRQLDTEKIEAILENIDEGFLGLDAQLTITRLNSSAERLLLQRRNDVNGKNLFEAFPALRGSVLEQRLAELLRAESAGRPDACSFEAHLEAAPFQGAYRFRINPSGSALGISAFFDRIAESERPAAADRG